MVEKYGNDFNIRKELERFYRMKIFFISLGCDKNLVDSEVMLGLIRDRGFELTNDESEADIIALSTMQKKKALIPSLRWQNTRKTVV